MKKEIGNLLLVIGAITLLGSVLAKPINIVAFLVGILFVIVSTIFMEVWEGCD